MMNKNIVPVLLALFILSSCTSSQVDGKWNYIDGTIDGKKNSAQKGEIVRRTFEDGLFEIHAIENGKSKKYGEGKYRVEGDTLYLTRTFSTHPSHIAEASQGYHFQIKDSILTQKATLPNGMKVEQRWKRVN